MLSKNSTIGILGAGAMGAGIAQVAAQSGHQVFVYDNNTAQLQKAAANLQSTLDKLIEKQKISKAASDKIIASIQWVDKLQLFDACDLIIEAVIEDLQVKHLVFQQLEKIVDNDCVLASNTSSLSITSLATACEKPGRFIGIHFFNPAPLMPLVEVIPGLASDMEILNDAKQLIESWNKIVVIAKDTPGFIVNRIARPFYGEAIRIYEEGLADFATIDYAMKSVGGFRMGPFELMDMIGNDVNYKVTETVWTQMFYDPRYKPSLTQKRLYEAKFFGRKTGRGYYSYAAGATMPLPDKESHHLQKIFLRIISMLINEAADALYLKIATADDIELSMTKGVNYPKGLLHWADEIGLETVLNELEILKAEYAEDRYRPSVLLKHMVKEHRKFFGVSFWH